MPQPRKQFCKHGHNKDIVGRDGLGRCKTCENARQRARYAANLEENRARCRERNRLDRLCLKEALTKEEDKTRQKLLLLIVPMLMYGRIGQ